MKHREPLTATLLSLLVPFYIIYWFYVTAKAMQNKGAKVPSVLLLVAPALLLVIIIPLMIYSMLTNSLGAGVGTIFLIMFLAPFSAVLSLIYYYKFSTAVEHVTNKALTKGLLFILFWFVAPAGVFLSQEKLNETQEQNNDTQATNPSSPSPITNNSD